MKILKNKKLIFGLTGFLTIGGITTLTVLLLNNQDNSLSKQTHKVDTSELNARSFAFQRKDGMSILWRSNIDLPKQVEVKGYLVTSKFNPNYKPSDNDYSANLPISYNNDNAIIYIKFFIKKQFKSIYQFPNDFQDTITFKNQSPPYVKNSYASTIFKDSQGNLWLLAKDSKLQVLTWNDETKQYATSWISNNSGLTNGSSIVDGYYGTIFEDSKGNIWAMGNNSKLQVLTWNDEKKQYASSWTSDSSKGLLNSSNINNGKAGKIFQDSRGNLWTMGKGTKLQVLAWNDQTKQYALSWVSVTCEGLTNSLEITDGLGGTIFEDSQGNLWAMSYKSKLQVLVWNSETKQYASSWTSDTSSGLTKGSKITNGVGGIIFEDSQHNLWAMGKDTKLQVLAWNDHTKQYVSSWTIDTSSELLKNSNVTNGWYGMIFEDSHGNLWTMGYGSKLQVLIWNSETKQYASSWTSDTSSGLTKGSKITNGVGGTIFEDSQGNLWAMGYRSKLQVLTWNDHTKQYASSWTIDTASDLLKNSNVTNGDSGAIFEDPYGNIWLGSSEKTFQVFDRTRQKWIQAPKLTTTEI